MGLSNWHWVPSMQRSWITCKWNQILLYYCVYSHIKNIFSNLNQTLHAHTDCIVWNKVEFIRVFELVCSLNLFLELFFKRTAKWAYKSKCVRACQTNCNYRYKKCINIRRCTLHDTKIKFSWNCAQSLKPINEVRH